MEPLPNKTLGQRLRELRQNADLSLRDLGEKLKDPTTNTPVSAAFLSDIENGRRFPSDDMIEKLAEILGADPMELRRCDPRGPAREIQDLATMNPQYAFAFRRAVEHVQGWKITPEEFIRRVEAGDIIFSSTDGPTGKVESIVRVPPAEAPHHDSSTPAPPAEPYKEKPRRRAIDMSPDVPPTHPYVEKPRRRIIEGFSTPPSPPSPPSPTSHDPQT